MGEKIGPAITAVGKYLPPNVITNDYFVRRGMNTSDEWIREHVGIVERRFVNPEQTSADLATEAAINALNMVDFDPKDIGGIIVATVTSQQVFPSTACRVQANLGASNGFAFDFAAACAGSVYGLFIAYSMLEAGRADNILLIGSDRLSTITNQDDRDTAILFGDGAGAVLIQNIKDPGPSYFYLGADGTKGDILRVDADNSGKHTIVMDGGAVYKQAVRRMTESANIVLNQANLTDDLGEIDPNKVGLVVAHQANRRIIHAIRDKLHLPDEKTYLNLKHTGNTSGASVFIAINDAYEEGKLNKGDTLLAVAIGGGLVWGGAVLQWNIKAPKIGFRRRISRAIHHHKPEE